MAKISKYAALEGFLKSQLTGRIAATFADVEKALGFSLPRSAYRHPAWWANDPTSHAQARSWLDAGFQAEQVDLLACRLVFRRIADTPIARPRPDEILPVALHPASGALGNVLSATFDFQTADGEQAPFPIAARELPDPGGPYLLDSCACVALADNSMSNAAKRALAHAYNARMQTYVSPITAFELAELERRGQLHAQRALRRWFAAFVALPGIAVAPMPPEVILEAGLFENFAPDPADRLIAATAREYGWTIMTRDQRLLDHGAKGYLRVVSC